ncbi:unnamed protein product [Protopolystoma xenopodis]|uniref:Uncharacterized protein n=1 Tax=Protopolystoma xenopodis TaxID=117903 RepID=A0A448WCE6_9PLAT|nr:unnamed protein product [Protopolystoma xenopodis]
MSTDLISVVSTVEIRDLLYKLWEVEYIIKSVLAVDRDRETDQLPLEPINSDASCQHSDATHPPSPSIATPPAHVLHPSPSSASRFDDAGAGVHLRGVSPTTDSSPSTATSAPLLF